MARKMSRKALEAKLREYAAEMLIDAATQSESFDHMADKLPNNWLEILLSVAIRIEYPSRNKKEADDAAKKWANSISDKVKKLSDKLTE